MSAKEKNPQNRKAWMLPLSVLLAAAGLFCFGLLLLAAQFTFPVKADHTVELPPKSLLDRSAYTYELPTEPPTEEVVEEEVPVRLPTYSMTINMATVKSNYAGNHDAVGWIKVPDTAVNYPIMQTDNNDYYVNHSSSGAHSSAGAIFADFRCNLDKTDNVLLYGHNMGNGSMFHAIKNYKSASWGNSHPYIEMASANHRYLYRVISCNVIYGEHGAKFEYWNFVSMNRGNFRYYYNSIRNTATVWYGDRVAPPKDNTDRLLVLQTCNSGASDGIRCVVFAQLIGDFTDTSYYDPNTESKMAMTNYPAGHQA